jgi:hypothetical protein
MTFNLPGALDYRKIAEAEEVLLICAQAGIVDTKLQEMVKKAKGLQANCKHEGWCRSDSFDLTCGECGASLFIGHRRAV